MSGCTSEIEICVTRGTVFDLDVTLGARWQEIIDNPSQYRARLVFRDFQDDTVPDLLTLIATPQLVTDAILTEPPVIISFFAAGPVTQTLPDYNLVGYCEIYEAVSPENPTRLFNTQVAVND